MGYRHLILAIVGFGFANSAMSGEWRPPVLRPPAQPGISGLRLDSKSLKLDVSNRREAKYSVRLSGNYKGDQNGSLIWSNHFVKPEADGSFEIQVPINGEVTPLNFVAIDGYGAIQKSPYEVVFDDWAQFQESVESDQVSIGALSVGLGPTLVSYRETSVSDYSSIALTAKAGYSRPVFSPRWSLGFTGFATVLPITESYAASARFLGFNIRLGYHFLKAPPPWKFSLQIGSYYTTMLVAQNQFGFENVTGPQLYPTLERGLTNGHVIRAYVKVSPLAANLSVLSFKSREFAGGVGYRFTPTNVKSYLVGFDYSDLLLQLPDQTIATKTVSLSLTYGF